jgi:DNA-binding MarR family transcriptional regulator
MARRTRRIIDYADRTVRLTNERLGHIREHPEMVGQEHGYRILEIAAHLGVHYATVSRRLKQLEQAK